MARVVLLLLSIPAAASAQILSPGPLGAAHAELEGLRKCTSCHELGEGVEADRCLTCHTELESRIARGGSFHNRVAKRECTSCHQDHEGRDAELSDWGGARSAFDHGRTGWPLRGKHGAATCESCHTANLVTPSRLQARLKKRAGSTHLGLGRQCAACHFDEHRGQLGDACASCHDQNRFAPASGFDHTKGWRLRGAHARVACKGCHADEADAARSAVLPPARVDRFVRYDIGRPKGCIACHRDVHRGKFGRKCERCHDETSWRRLRGAGNDVSFHDKTRFPLRGKHRAAECGSCHPPAAGGGMKARGLAFASCSDCHLDAHLGQLDLGNRGCAICHDEDGFYPPRFGVGDHQRTRYPLVGAHRVVACSACHVTDEAGLEARVPARPGADATRTRGNELVNFTRFVFPAKVLGDCSSCHRDAHAGQFSGSEPKKVCAACHTLGSFTEVAIDHDRDTRFPLRGRHRGVDCKRCHVDAEPGAVAYRGASRECETCHQGYHLGQFAGERGCDACHDESGFAPPRFSHDDVFALDGAHRKVTCGRCHPPVASTTTAWYHGVPRRCEGCHENIHVRTAAGRRLIADADDSADCSVCHRTRGWHEVRFDHENTRLPLRGRHAEIECRACHDRMSDNRMDARCQSCHVDVHAGRLGHACGRCHEATSFRDGLGVAAHDQTRFPLYGRHALIPCDECHLARSDATFGGVPSRCESCHLDAYLGTAGSGLDHAAAGIDRACERCHNSVAWPRGLLPEHDRCFRLTRGHHRGFGCLECHTASPGVAIDGSCDTFNAACTRCHSCARMDEKHDGEEPVPGYQCADRKCYECHPGGTEDG